MKSMGLLMHNLSKSFYKVADEIYDQHFVIDKKLETEYDDYRKQKMYEDILHNLSFLEVALRLNDMKLFDQYALWLFQLMGHLLVDLPLERVKEHMIVHYQLMKAALNKYLVEEEYRVVEVILDKAIELTTQIDTINTTSDFMHGAYSYHRETYLNYLLEGDGKRAIQYIRSLYHTGIPLEDIYVDILQSVMTEVGHRWHQTIIPVNQEHYISSITQMAIAQFYDVILQTKKKGLKMVSCSVGSELHQIGIRMISDLFEYHGWDSIFLGAALPKAAILKSIDEHQPQLIALSVTMPQHLLLCQELITAIKEAYPSLRIAIGGRAFQMTNELWKKWPVDIYVDDAKALLEWAEKMWVSS